MLACAEQMWEGDEDDDRFRNTAGTAAFMSPEMCTGKDFSGKVSKPTPTCPATVKRHLNSSPTHTIPHPLPNSVSMYGHVASHST